MDGQLKAGALLVSESSNKYRVISLLGAGGQASSGYYPLDWCPRKSHRAAKEPQANVGGLLCPPIK